MRKRTLFILLCLLWVGIASAQRIIDRSDKLQPRWVKHPPVSQTIGMSYHVVIVSSPSPNLESITNLALEPLIKQLPSEWEVSVDRENIWTTNTERENESITSNKRTDIINHRVYSHGAPVQLQCRLVDAYWEKKDPKLYTCYLLYQVADPKSPSEFENVALKTSYGAHGLYSVLVPGASQFYKGSYVKGGCILGGSALLAGGIIWTHSSMNSYYNLENSTHNSQSKQIYHTKAQNYMIGRNVLIGALGALYVYNVIDAFVAPGARRVVRTGGHMTQFSFAPIMWDEMTPALAMKITF